MQLILRSIEVGDEFGHLASNRFLEQNVWSLGRDEKRLWKYHSLEKLTKAELEETLRAHHAACDEMNSEERERYEAWKEAQAGDDEILKQIYAHNYEGLMTAKELKITLEAHRSGDRGKVFTIFLKCQKALE